MDAEELQPVDPVTGIQVVLRSVDNEMLVTQSDGGFAYTDQLGQAIVFDLVADDVLRSIYEIQKNLGHIWVAWPLRVEDALERCDGCGNCFAVDKVMMRDWQFVCAKCQGIPPPEPLLGGTAKVG
jgi:hypothetical protein